jgi:hypothetical protein
MLKEALRVEQMSSINMAVGKCYLQYVISSLVHTVKCKLTSVCGKRVFIKYL